MTHELTTEILDTLISMKDRDAAEDLYDLLKEQIAELDAQDAAVRSLREQVGTIPSLQAEVLKQQAPHTNTNHENLKFLWGKDLCFNGFNDTCWIDLGNNRADIDFQNVTDLATLLGVPVKLFEPYLNSTMTFGLSTGYVTVKYDDRNEDIREYLWEKFIEPLYKGGTDNWTLLQSVLQKREAGFRAQGRVGYLHYRIYSDGTGAIHDSEGHEVDGWRWFSRITDGWKRLEAWLQNQKTNG